MSSLTEKIKELRDRTSMSFDQIKKALEEAGGEVEHALKILAKQGASIAAKKSSRSTGEGIIECYVHATKKTAAIVALLCETDFVAKNPIFTELAHNIAMHVAAMNPVDNEELLGQPFIKDQDMTIKDLIEQSVAKLGENIQISHFARYSI